MAYGYAETRSGLSGDEEISLYATENYRYGPTALRRYTVRQDGFWSWQSPWREGRYSSTDGWSLFLHQSPCIYYVPGTLLGNTDHRLQSLFLSDADILI